MSKLDFVSDVTGKYTNFLNSGIDRWKTAVAEARKQQYSSSKLVSDVVSYWADGVGLSIDAWQQLFAPTEPVVTFNLKPTDTTAIETVPIPETTPGVLMSTALNLAGGKGSIDAGKVSAKVSANGRNVIVELTGLTTPMAEGLYEGEVGDSAGAKVATIELHVQA